MRKSVVIGSAVASGAVVLSAATVLSGAAPLLLGAVQPASLRKLPRPELHRDARHPIKSQMFSPEPGSVQGSAGIGAVVDLSFSTWKPALLPAKFRLAIPATLATSGPAAPPGENPAFPGLVVTMSTTPASAGGPNENLANLFQITSVSRQADGAYEVWATWTNPKPLFGVGVPATVTAYTVAGKAPSTVPAGRAGLVLTSKVIEVPFWMAGAPKG